MSEYWGLFASQRAEQLLPGIQALKQCCAKWVEWMDGYYFRGFFHLLEYWWPQRGKFRICGFMLFLHIGAWVKQLLLM